MRCIEQVSYAVHGGTACHRHLSALL